MNHPPRPWIFLPLIALLARIAGAQPVDLQIGPATVEAAAVTDGVFRLSLCYDGKPHPAQSVYLAPNPTPVSSTTVTENAWTGVKTSAGELLIDQADGLWTLRDPQGKTLIPPGPIGQSTRNVQTGKPFVILNVGCPSDRNFDVYGCGNGADALLQDHARPARRQRRCRRSLLLEPRWLRRPRRRLRRQCSPRLDRFLRTRPRELGIRRKFRRSVPDARRHS